MGENRSRDARRRLTIDQAADQLGITVDAVRGRVKRGTIAHEREGGRVYVLLDAAQPRPGHDQDTDQGADQPGDRTAELIATLREQLQAERQAHAEARRIIAGLVERIPAIEAPQEETRESSEAVEEAQGGGDPRPDRGAQEGARRPWWRRVFGG